MFKVLLNSVLMLLVLTLIVGLLYPLAVTGIAQAVFSQQANGSLIEVDGHTVGSSLIGQSFSNPKYFWSRPSATTVTGGTDALPYNAESSNASNLGPTNPDLTKAIAERVQKLRQADADNKAPVPVDLVTTSSSGLDPDISPAAAEFQVGRVAKARNLAPEAVRKLVARNKAGRLLGAIGEPRVNVLQLNLDLDRLH